MYALYLIQEPYLVPEMCFNVGAGEAASGA